MRYYEIPDRPVWDNDSIRPTRVSRFAGGPKSTEFTDPTTGEKFRAIRIDDRRGRYEAEDRFGSGMDFRYPVDPGMKYRIRKDGSIRPIGWKVNVTPERVRV